MRRFSAVAAATLLATLAGCNRSDQVSDASAARPADTAVETTTTTAPVPAPLTGVAAVDTSVVQRPALVVKVDNAPQARPQAGLEKADAVFEEVVEGGVVRFLAVFHSQDAPTVGPVRSVRPVDPDIVTPLGGLFAYSGGAPQFVSMIKRAPVKLVGFDELTKAYSKRRDRPAPHNLFTSTKALFAAGSGSAPPPALFTFLPAGQAFAPAGATPASHVEVVMGSPSRTAWDWEAAAGVWRRSTNGTPHTVEGGSQLGFANVVIQYVRYSNTSSRDPAGFPVPTADVIGSGTALVLSNGRAVKATWTKTGRAAVTEYRDASGTPLSLTPGTTWVSLAPAAAATTVR